MPDTEKLCASCIRQKKEARLSQFQVLQVFGRTAYRIITVNEQFQYHLGRAVKLICEILYADKAGVMTFYGFCRRHIIYV